MNTEIYKSLINKSAFPSSVVLHNLSTRVPAFNKFLEDGDTQAVFEKLNVLQPEGVEVALVPTILAQASTSTTQQHPQAIRR